MHAITLADGSILAVYVFYGHGAIAGVNYVAAAKLAEERKAMPPVETTREGKPSKRDRREIARLRGRA